MASTNGTAFQLSIVSADQRLPSQMIDVDAEWTTIDLKRHLSKVYPGEPPVESQKLIFAGRILSDDSKLRTIIDQESISRTVHLVLSPSVASQAKAAVAAQELSSLTPEQTEQLKQQYLQYLNDYYKNDNGTVSNDQNGQEESDNEDEIINVEIDLNDNFDVPANGFQRFARALGMGGGGADADAQEHGIDMGVAEQVDLFDLAYAVFRISILIAICVTYASWERIALVTVVGLIFYWFQEENEEFNDWLFDCFYAILQFCFFMGFCVIRGSWQRALVVVAVGLFLNWRNGARQNEIRRQRQNPPVAAPARVPPPPSPAQQNADAPDSGTLSTTTTSGAATEGGDAAPPSTGNPQQEQEEPPTRVQQIAQVLRGAGETSYRLVYAIFASLVPELPARID